VVLVGAVAAEAVVFSSSSMRRRGRRNLL